MILSHLVKWKFLELDFRGNGDFYLPPIENASQKLYARSKDMETFERDMLETKAFSFPYVSEQKTHSVWPV